MIMISISTMNLYFLCRVVIIELRRSKMRRSSHPYLLIDITNSEIEFKILKI
jgi:hypothetical protein